MKDREQPDHGDVRVSVCMATYNGGEYVAEQIASILPELGADGELVIVDDASTDSTVEVIGAIGDPRIRLFPRDINKGYVRTFEEALRRSRGRYLFLADQDDVWVAGRIEVMLDGLRHRDVVASNLGTLGGPDRIPGPLFIKDWQLRARDSAHNVRNVLRVLAGTQCYWGCAMAVRREALSYLLPFPTFLIESHDLWIGINGNVQRSMEHVASRTIRRRFHDTNQTPLQPRGIVPVIRSRFMLLRCIAVAGSRRYRATCRVKGVER